MSCVEIEHEFGTKGLQVRLIEVFVTRPVRREVLASSVKTK